MPSWFVGRNKKKKNEVIEPKTVTTNSGSLSSFISQPQTANTGGIAQSFSQSTQQPFQKVEKTAVQKAEEERAARMRQGLSSYIRAEVKRNQSKLSAPTYVKKGLFSNLRTNALTPVKQTADYTRSQQNRFLTTDLQRKGLYTPATQLMAQRTNVGVTQGRALRAGMPTQSNVIESWRPTASAKEIAARKKYGLNELFRKAQVDDRLKGSAINDPESARMTKKWAEEVVSAPEGVDTKFDRVRMADVMAGHSDAWARKHAEDTLKRQFGTDLDEDTLAELEAQRAKSGYMLGQMTGQTEQYLLTRGALSGVGLVGRAAQAERAAKAAGDLAKAKKISFLSELGIDQAASLPLNVIDALKENNAQDIIKRYGLNQLLDVAFSAGMTGASVFKNPAFKEAEILHNTAKSLREQGDNAAAEVADIAAKNKLREIPREELEASKQEAYNIGRGIDNGTEQPTATGIRTGESDLRGASPEASIRPETNQSGMGRRPIISEHERVTGNGDHVVLSEPQRAVLDNAGITNANMGGADRATFSNALNESRAANKYGSYVDPQSVENLEANRAKTFLSDDGMVGIAVEQDGNIVGAFKNPNSRYQNSVTDMLLTARANGGTKMDCYGEKLVRMYEDAGYIPVAKVAFDPAFVDDPLLLQNKPTIYVMMKNSDDIDTAIRKTANREYEHLSKEQLNTLPTMEYKDAMRYRDELLAKQSGQSANSAWDEIDNEIADMPAPKTRDMTKVKPTEEVPNWKERLDGEYADLIEKNDNFEQKLKEAQKGGTFDNGTPKEVEGERVSQAEAKLTDENSMASTDAKLESMRRTIEEHAGRNEGRGVKETQEEAAKRWADHPDDSIRKLMDAVNARTKKEKVPKGYESTQDFFADGYEGLKYYQGIQNKAGEGTDEYWRAVDAEADLIDSIRAVASDMGAGFRQYQEILRGSKEARKAMVRKAVEDLKKEWASVLKGKDVEIPEDLLEKYAKADNALDTAKALDELSVAVWNQIPATKQEITKAWRMSAMLLNPKTHARNIFGNALFLPAIMMKDMFATPIEKALVKAGKIDPEQATKAFISRYNAKDKPFLDAGRAVWDKYERLIRGNNRYFDVPSAKSALGRRPLEGDVYTAGNKNPNKALRAIEKKRKIGSSVLEAEDRLFMKRKFIRTYAKIVKARGYDPAKMTEEQILNTMEVARQEALRSTYRDANALADAINKTKSYSPSDSTGKKIGAWATDATLPFVTTLVNIARRSKDYSVVGLIEGIGKLSKALHNGDSAAAVKAIDRMSAGLSGSAVMALGAYCGMNGIVTVELSDDAEGYYDRDLGYQNYSLKIGGDDGTSVSLDWLQPMAIPFFMGAKFGELQQEGIGADEWGKYITAAGSMFNPLFEMSLMQSPAELIEAMRDGENMGEGVINAGVNIGLNYLGQFNPTIHGQLARTIDPTRRDTSSTADSAIQRSVEKWANKQIAKTPLLSKTLEPYVDVWGEEQKTLEDNPALRQVYQFWSPAYVNRIKTTAIDKELKRLNDTAASDEQKIIPRKYFSDTLKLGDESVTLSKEDLTEFNKKRGQARKNALDALIKTDEYKNANDDEKRKLINKTMRDVDTDVTRDMLVKKGANEWSVYTEGLKESAKEQAASAKTAGIGAKDYYLAVTDPAVDRNGNNSTDEWEVYKYLDGSEFDQKQKAVMWTAMGKNADNNPFDGGDIPEERVTIGSGEDAVTFTYPKEIEEAGITRGQYAKIATIKEELDKNGNESVSQYELYSALKDMNGFTNEQKATIWNNYNKSWKNNPFDGGDVPEEKFKVGDGDDAVYVKYPDAIKDAGVSLEQYAEVVTKKDKIDTDNSGGVSQAELKTYLDGMDLTTAQKSAIWKSYNKRWKKNPYEGDSLSSGGKSGGKRSRSGRRRSSGSSKKSSAKKAVAKTASEKKFASLQTGKAPSKSYKTTAREKTESEKRFAELQQNHTKKTPVTANTASIKGLTKAQRKALLKLAKKKLEV